MQRPLRWLSYSLPALSARRAGLTAAALSVALAAACTSLSPAPHHSQSPPAAASTAPAPALSAELADVRLREAAFDQAWRIVHERFYDPAFNGVDWEAVRWRYLPQIERVRTDAAFYALLGRMVGELRDSHTRVYNARDYRNRLDYVVSTFGLRVTEIDGEVAIVQVLPDTDAARAGLSAGMIIEAVNGEAARERLAWLRADAPADASPERRLRGIYGRLIAGRGNESLVLDVRDVRGAQGVARFELKRAEREVPLVVTRRMLEGNVGYIAFNRFRPEAAADFGRALGALNDTDGLVLDLRGNPGGSIGAMLSIAQSFFPESRHVLTRRSRGSGPAAPAGDSWPQARLAPPEVRINASPHAYTGPLAILIDGHTASSSELLATVLREQRSAWIVGRPSCGCVVAVRGTGYRLPGGGALYVAESGFITPLGNRMEGAGMRPDREVLLTLADLREGVDRDLAVAKDWIMQRAQRIAEEP
jgi:carboxyl-terminal processing protease